MDLVPLACEDAISCVPAHIPNQSVWSHNLSTKPVGGQWVNGRVIDSRPRGRAFEPHRRHCVVSSSKTHYS